MNGPSTIDCDSVEATRRVGRRLGSHLRVGDVVALVGPLGSGKTTLVKGVAAGAGVSDLRQVNSPTFVIVNEYDAAGRPDALHIYHIDVYRLRGSDDLDAIGFDEMCRHGAVVVEWADRVVDLLPDDRLTIEIEPTADTRRRLTFIPGGPNARRLMAPAF
ncbi:MAG: tRNA (adenosine(37)-N6)-threonylcarbamoyltransferase complex ATPase subunit type 1 TsaE [Planctomycetes bacterium]|nr:tRNA (adenosine(37)-N6)-threonylcarbamoyltransferase complex ATPase subunit type 1 TsaE [Planctomycetota bacterium]